MEAKKPKNRRAYLDNYARGMDGKYIYTGKYVSFKGSESEKSRLNAVMIVSAACVFLCLVGESFTLAGQMSATFYVVLPYVFEIIFSFFFIWYTIKFIHGGNPLKEHIYEKVVKRLPVFIMLVVIFSGISLILTGVYILTKGPDDFRGIIYLILKLIVVIVGIFCFATLRKGKWELGKE